MEVRLPGRAPERRRFEVTHSAGRVAGQGNVATWLHPDTALRGLLREQDYTGYFLTLEQREGDDYAFIIDVEEAGPFTDPAH